MSDQTLRFYPDCFPIFDYEPTRDRFDIRRIGDGVGEGIVCLTHFEPGQIAFRFAGVLLNDITLFTLQYAPGLHLHDPFFMGKLLHSCDPNLSCDMEKREFTVLRPIMPGDLLTMDYEQTEDVLYRPFTCECGAANCKGLITGRAVRAAAEAGFAVMGAPSLNGTALHA